MMAGALHANNPPKLVIFKHSKFQKRKILHFQGLLIMIYGFLIEMDEKSKLLRVEIIKL